MVVRGIDGLLYWQNDDGSLDPYTGQDGGNPPPPGQQGNLNPPNPGVGTGQSGDPLSGPVSGVYGSGSSSGTGLNLGPNGYPLWSGTGSAPWALAEATGVPFNTWLAKTQADQATATKKADLAVEQQQAALDHQNQLLSQQGGTAAANAAENRRQFDISQTTPDAYQRAQLANTQTQQAATAAQQQAQLAQNAQQFAAQQDLTRGNTLLGLGSRPDTLIKYLYAMRGQQTPQAIAGTTTNLPGYQNVIGQPTPGATIATPSTTAAGAGGGPSTPSAPAATPSTAPSLLPGTTGMLTQQPASLLQNNAANPTYQQNLQQIATPQNYALQEILRNAQAPTSQTTAVQNNTQSQGLSAPYNPNVTAAQNAAGPKNTINGINLYGQGGLIPEKVVGVGQDSGQTYEFGEKGTEAVVSNDMLERLMQVAGKVDLHQKSKDGGSQRFSFILNSAPKMSKEPTSPSKQVNSYADGGSIGYNPSTVPSLGSQSSGFFNDPNLSTVVNRGYNSSPSTPLFPQVGIATGGGQSLVPSMQRLNSLLPSEQSLYAGALQDEFGANPEDVFSLSKRLAPGATNLSTPHFKN